MSADPAVKMVEALASQVRYGATVHYAEQEWTVEETDLLTGRIKLAPVPGPGAHRMVGPTTLVVTPRFNIQWDVQE